MRTKTGKSHNAQSTSPDLKQVLKTVHWFIVIISKYLRKSKCPMLPFIRF
jgi:hypothetical protein